MHMRSKSLLKFISKENGSSVCRRGSFGKQRELILTSGTYGQSTENTEPGSLEQCVEGRQETAGMH